MPRPGEQLDAYMQDCRTATDRQDEQDNEGKQRPRDDGN
jgi:hypothetical protein